MIELPTHPFFIGGQFHPELKSTVESPAPIFVSFIQAAKNFAEIKNGKAKQAEEKMIHD
jgi:CTP synthase